MISTSKLREAVFFSVFLKQITFLMAIRMTGSGGGLKQQPPSVCVPGTRFYHRLLPSYWHLLSEPYHYSITCSWLRKVPAAWNNRHISLSVCTQAFYKFSWVEEIQQFLVYNDLLMNNLMWLMMLSIFFASVENQLTDMWVSEIIWWQSRVHFNF